MVRGVNSCLESNLMPARDAQRAQTILMLPGPRDSTETETELCLSISCRGMGQKWTATVTGALGAADLGIINRLGGGHLNSTIELPDHTQDWERDCWRAQTVITWLIMH